MAAAVVAVVATPARQSGRKVAESEWLKLSL